MRVSGQPQPISPADAEARLRYVNHVRARTRDTTATPLLLLGMLGALVLTRGVLLLCWPHVAGLSGAWYLSVTVVGIGAALWLEQHQREHTGVMPAQRGRLIMLAATIAVELLAHVIGTNVIIAGIAVPLAFAEWRTGSRITAGAIAAIGVISDAIVLGGTRPWVALVVFGVGLIAVAAAGRRSPGQTA